MPETAARGASCLKSIDKAGVPVTLNLNQQGVHQTSLGGLCSLIVTLLTCFVLYAEFVNVFVKSNFTIESEVTYLDEVNELDVEQYGYEIESDLLIPAILFTNLNRHVDDVSRYMRIGGFYYIREVVNDQYVFKEELFKPVPCQDIYPQGSNGELFNYFRDSYEGSDAVSTSGWYCPPLDVVIKVQNDPWVNLAGISTGMSIYQCTEGAKVGEDVSNCVTDEEDLLLFEKETAVQTKFVTKYFNPTSYQSEGDLIYRSTSTLITGLDGNPDRFLSSNVSISKNEVDFWGSKVLDLSVIENFFSPQQETFYDSEFVQNISSRYADNLSSQKLRYFVNMVQCFEVNNLTCKVRSIDASLALIGGYTALLWQIVGLLIGAYQSFSYESTLINHLYTEEKSSDPQTQQTNDQEAIEQKVHNRAPHHYGFKDYISVALMKLFCSCCCKRRDWYQARIKRYEAHLALKEAFSGQLDILTLIKWLRISQFLAMTRLKWNQAELVQYSSAYCQPAEEGATMRKDVTEIEGGQEAEEQQVTMDELLGSFRPEEDLIDRMILYQITGRELAQCMQDWRKPSAQEITTDPVQGKQIDEESQIDRDRLLGGPFEATIQ